VILNVGYWTRLLIVFYLFISNGNGKDNVVVNDLNKDELLKLPMRTWHSMMFENIFYFQKNKTKQDKIAIRHITGEI